MQIPATSTVTGAFDFGSAGEPVAPKTLNQDDFFKLLSVQMQSQDPLNPMQDTEFIAQMASFSSLEQMKNLSSSFAAFVTQQNSNEAAGYLGKTVTVLDPEKGLITGVVSKVTFAEEGAQLIVNGKTFDPAMVTAVQVTTAETPSFAPTTPNNS